MGLDINSVQFLIDARKQGVEFGDVLTLGRQDLNVYPAKMVNVLESHGFPASAFKGDDKVLYAEPCFMSMGAKKVSSMDFSDFEGADHVHDLNKPVGAELKERFDLVYDGGTLEHVFNFPVACTAPQQSAQQSDDTPRWQPANPGEPPPVSYETPRPALAGTFPGLARLVNVFKNGLGLLRSHTLWNRKSYRPVPKP